MRLRFRLVLDQPLFAKRLQRLALNGSMPIRQHERRRCAHPRAYQAEIGSRVEQARVPALPARQKNLHLFAQTPALR